MTSSLDGRLRVDRCLRRDTETERALVGSTYEQLAARLGTEGWMVGRKTMEEFAFGAPRAFAASSPDPRKPFVGQRKGRKVAVAVDLHGKLHYGRDDALGDHLIAILGPDVPDEYLAELRHDGVSYLFTPARGEPGHGSPAEELRHAMNVLGDGFGIRSLMLQGGGITNGTFLKAGLIDEISLIVYPGIDGLTGMPAIFECAGEANERPAAGSVLEHVATETLDSGLVWLRYRIGKADTPAAWLPSDGSAPR
jgi:5-amino-6-(5-phosphoribosylamino)uracil reductase